MSMALEHSETSDLSRRSERRVAIAATATIDRERGGKSRQQAPTVRDVRGGGSRISELRLANRSRLRRTAAGDIRPSLIRLRSWRILIDRLVSARRPTVTSEWQARPGPIPETHTSIAPSRFCSTPRRCASYTREVSDRRYSTAAWQRLSRAVLRRDGHLVPDPRATVARRYADTVHHRLPSSTHPHLFWSP